MSREGMRAKFNVETTMWSNWITKQNGEEEETEREHGNS